MRQRLLAAALMGAGALAACSQAEPEEKTGEELYLANCASCHGVQGRGDGPLAAGLARPPADLTLLAKSENPFPTVQVMSQIHGYFRRDSADEVMPEFDEVLDGPTIYVDTGDGIPTPTPQPLVALAAYLETLQQEPSASTE